MNVVRWVHTYSVDTRLHNARLVLQYRHVGPDKGGDGVHGSLVQATNVTVIGVYLWTINGQNLVKTAYQRLEMLT